MSGPFKPSIGAVMSADIAVPQHELMVQFYSQILTTGEQPLWQADLMNNRGMPIIGLGAQSSDYADLPLQWMPHFQVANVAASVASALAHGGRELMHGKDDEGGSQWAVMVDPSGAAFGLIPVVSEEMVQSASEHTTTGQSDKVGHIAWLDLTVANATITAEFYQAVVGWETEAAAMQDGDDAYDDYVMLNGDGQPAAGVCHAKGVNVDLPPVWLLYLPVGDLATSLTQVKLAGGQVVKQSKNQAGQTTQAMISDPAGVHLMLVQA